MRGGKRVFLFDEPIISIISETKSAHQDGGGGRGRIGSEISAMAMAANATV